MQRLTRCSPWREHAHVRAGMEPTEIGLAQVPLLKLRRSLDGECLGHHVYRSASVLSVAFEPRSVVLCTKVREGVEHVRQIPLHVDDERGDGRAQRLFGEYCKQSSLTTASHADHHTMSHEVVCG